MRIRVNSRKTDCNGKTAKYLGLKFTIIEPSTSRKVILVNLRVKLQYSTVLYSISMNQFSALKAKRL